jgi:hypothetical protein
LREDVAAALEDAHDIAVGRAKAQAQYNQAAVDGAYAAAQPAEPRRLFVKRGGAWGHVERCRLKPGELIFTRTPAGDSWVPLLSLFWVMVRYSVRLFFTPNCLP